MQAILELILRFHIFWEFFLIDLEAFEPLDGEKFENVTAKGHTIVHIFIIRSYIFFKYIICSMLRYLRNIMS